MNSSKIQDYMRHRFCQNNCTINCNKRASDWSQPHLVEILTTYQWPGVPVLYSYYKKRPIRTSYEKTKINMKKRTQKRSN